MMTVRPAAFLFLAAALLVAGPAAADDPRPSAVRIDVTTIAFDPGEADRERFGGLLWRGGLKLRSDDPRFGGFSGLVVDPDGRHGLAVSDQGWWLDLTLAYDERGRLAGAGKARMATLLDGNGRRFPSKERRDAEALTALSPQGPAGPVAVGFERTVRILAYDMAKAPLEAVAAPPLGLDLPEDIHSGPDNAELESLARITEGQHAGRFLAISERNLDSAGNIRAWLLGEDAPVGFALRRLDDFSVTDAAMLSPNRFVTLERSFNAVERRLEMAIRRFDLGDIARGATLDGELLLRARWPRRSIDNMEAIAVHRTADGETRLTVMSDDNYNTPLQRTLVLQFALPPAE